MGVTGIASLMKMKTGVNFGANGWSYSVSSDEFESICQKLQGKVSYVCFCPHWSSLERNPGAYNAALLDNIIRLCNIASEHGIQSAVDIHTHMKTSYALPNELEGNFCKIFDVPSLYNRWLNLLGFVSEYLGQRVNLAWFDMMNEPARYSGDPCGQISLDRWMNLFQDMYNKCKPNLLDTPLGLRIAEPAFPGFDYDPRILDAVDVMTINVYIGTWTTKSKYDQLIQWIKSNSSHSIIIDEFGKKTNNETEQAESIRSQLQLFKNDVSTAMAWVLNPDASVCPENYGGWNLARGRDEFKTAIDVLAQFNEDEGGELPLSFEKTVTEVVAAKGPRNYKFILAATEPDAPDGFERAPEWDMDFGILGKYWAFRATA